MRRRRTASGFELRAYPPPPQGFDALTATEAQLMAHGFPATLRDHPDFESVFAPRIAATNFEPVRFRRRRSRRTSGANLRHAAQSGKSGQWSGVVAKPPLGDSIVAVEARWVIPPFAPPVGATPGMTYVASLWIGIDGCLDSHDVLQAGCDVFVSQNSFGAITTRCESWLEWYPGESHAIDLAVSQGDSLHCFVMLDAGNPSMASAWLTNETTNQARNLGVVSPGVGLIGNCAEWIVEAYGNLGPLARFDVVDFVGCSARTRSGTVVSSDGGSPIRMIDGTRIPAAAGMVFGPSAVRVAHI